jgi:RES domain-containing protein
MRAVLERREFALSDTHRLIPSKFSAGGTVLAELAEGDEAVLHDLVALDAATNTRLKADEGLLPGISVHELVYGVAYFQIVNAAFTHAAPFGGRFNTDQRGAWYAGVELATSMAEVAWHKLRQLEEIAWADEEVSTYDDYLADFHAAFEELDGGKESAAYLKPDPVPACYAEPQKLATRLLGEGSNGIVYPSVRREGGTCVACFRPALVYHVRRTGRYAFRLRAGRPFRRGQAHKMEDPD